jgi:hypothetical protein
MIKAIQIIEFYDSFASAQQGLEFQRTQEGYLGGRILGPDAAHLHYRTGWRMQAFYDADGVEEGTLLPDGMRLVVIPDSLKRTLFQYEPAAVSRSNSYIPEEPGATTGRFSFSRVPGVRPTRGRESVVRDRGDKTC